MIKVTVNNKKTFETDSKDNKVFIDGQEVNPDIIALSDSRFHMIMNNKSYRMMIHDQADDKHMVVEVNGNKYTVSIQDNFDILLHELGMDDALSNKVVDIKAPMPGLVLNILVNEGDEVEKDTPLLVLEAMKMENVLKSPGSGIIDAVKVKLKDAVEKGQLLITFK